MPLTASWQTPLVPKPQQTWPWTYALDVFFTASWDSWLALRWVTPDFKLCNQIDDDRNSEEIWSHRKSFSNEFFPWSLFCLQCRNRSNLLLFEPTILSDLHMQQQCQEREDIRGMHLWILTSTSADIKFQKYRKPSSDALTICTKWSVKKQVTSCNFVSRIKY